jgi:hypothetical protein
MRRMKRFKCKRTRMRGAMEQPPPPLTHLPFVEILHHTQAKRPCSPIVET